MGKVEARARCRRPFRRPALAGCHRPARNRRARNPGRHRWRCMFG